MTKIWNETRPKATGEGTDRSINDIHPHDRSNSQKMVQGGAGSRHLDFYGAKHSAAAVRGAHMAKPPEHPDDDDSFKHTVGCMPNVHGHVKCFEGPVNMAGGVNQHAPFGETHTDSGRPNIHGYRQLFHTQAQTSGDTFQKMRHKARTKNG